MNEGIHGERTASEPQDRVTELIERKCCAPLRARRTTCSPSSTSAVKSGMWVGNLLVANRLRRLPFSASTGNHG
jgi:hypothetical protein